MKWLLPYAERTHTPEIKMFPPSDGDKSRLEKMVIMVKRFGCLVMHKNDHDIQLYAKISFKLLYTSLHQNNDHENSVLTD